MKFRNSAITLLIITLIFLGGLRHLLFISVNAQIEYLNGRLHSSGLIDNLSFLADWDLGTLTTSKWLLTIFFTLTFFGVSALAIWILYHDKKKIMWLLYLYIGLFVISGIFFISGRLFHLEDIGYTIARRCMGALQSPFPAMMLVPAFELLKITKLKQ